MSSPPNYTKLEKGFLKAEENWTTLSDTVALLFLGIAKAIGSDANPYASLYLVGAIFLFLSACIDIPASHIRTKDTSAKWMRWVNVVADWIFGVLALGTLITVIVAVSDSDVKKDALNAAYIMGIVKYGLKIIQKTLKAIKEYSSGKKIRYWDRNEHGNYPRYA